MVRNVLGLRQRIALVDVLRRDIGILEGKKLCLKEVLDRYSAELGFLVTYPNLKAITTDLDIKTNFRHATSNAGGKAKGNHARVILQLCQFVDSLAMELKYSAPGLTEIREFLHSRENKTT